MKRFISVIFVGALLASLAGLFVVTSPTVFVHPKPRYSAYKPALPQRIAHSGGAIDGRVYTNSLEALNSNYAKGYRYFEVDLERTSDGQTVVLHDWENAFLNLFGKPSVTRSSEEFVNARSPHGYHQLTDDDLVDWAIAHPEARIVLDMKSHYMATLNSFASDRPAERVRFIPFIYSPDQYLLTQNMGFQNPLWLIDYAGSTDADVMSFASQYDLTGVAMKASRADTGLPVALRQHGVPTFVWTINDDALGKKLTSSAVLGLITDNLNPDCQATSQSIGPASQHTVHSHRPIPLSYPKSIPCFGISVPVLTDRQRVIT